MPESFIIWEYLNTHFFNAEQDRSGNKVGLIIDKKRLGKKGIYLIFLQVIYNIGIVDINFYIVNIILVTIKNPSVAPGTFSVMNC